jgi:hypothetical protein
MLLLMSTISAVFALNTKNSYEDKTSVLVVGTIQGQHAANPKYSYQHLIQILTTYAPALFALKSVLCS